MGDQLSQKGVAGGSNSQQICSPPMDGFLRALSNLLEHIVLVASLDGVDCPGTRTRFHGVSPPSISIYHYLRRVESHFRCSSECFVIALIYIDRLLKTQGPNFVVTMCAIHRVILTSVVLAAKFFDDRYYSNRFYAAVGGVRTKELNALEADFLRLINWNLHTFPEEYEAYRMSVWTSAPSELTPPLTPPPLSTPQELIINLIGARASSVATISSVNTVTESSSSSSSSEHTRDTDPYVGCDFRTTPSTSVMITLCNSSDAAIYLATLNKNQTASEVLSRPRNFSDVADFPAKPSWSSPPKDIDRANKDTPTTSTDTESALAALSTTADVSDSTLTSGVPQSESQASLVAMVTSDEQHDQHLCCDASVSTPLDGEEKFLQEFVFGSSAFQVDFVGTMTKSLLDRISPNEMVSFPDLPPQLRGVTRFYSLRAPSISVHAYLKRFEKHFMCSRECYLIALIYLDRLSESCDCQFRITRRSIHKFFLTALVIAVKYFDDLYYDNKYYAHVGGVRVAELNCMEATFLQLIEWHLFVSPEEFAQCAKRFLIMGSSTPSPTEGPVEL
ncbi:mitochondrial peripheral inner membrane protein [Perkinsus olseni]|uniref:Mitochondrial peripheral inner membrane protein n=1 Tax=Perkinsus olseni TaxID=32597 RepID=A0A7J6LL13_PEROL|nr:mitochondrial peripheral inner membrane protein [Perkinsus olseni]KAF4664193.1 mitochondrial peripheral inner membrane protein [Perkinsus olseni]